MAAVGTHKRYPFIAREDTAILKYFTSGGIYNGSHCSAAEFARTNSILHPSHRSSKSVSNRFHQHLDPDNFKGDINRFHSTIYHLVEDKSFLVKKSNGMAHDWKAISAKLKSLTNVQIPNGKIKNYYNNLTNKNLWFAPKADSRLDHLDDMFIDEDMPSETLNIYEYDLLVLGEGGELIEIKRVTLPKEKEDEAPSPNPSCDSRMSDLDWSGSASGNVWTDVAGLTNDVVRGTFFGDMRGLI